MMQQLRRLIFGDTRIRPILPSDVEPAALPPHQQERKDEGDRMSLRLMLEAHEAAATSVQIRKALGREVAIKLQRRA